MFQTFVTMCFEFADVIADIYRSGNKTVIVLMTIVLVLIVVLCLLLGYLICWEVCCVSEDDLIDEDNKTMDYKVKRVQKQSLQKSKHLKRKKEKTE